jgi:hypothetical protein
MTLICPDYRQPGPFAEPGAEMSVLSTTRPQRSSLYSGLVDVFALAAPPRLRSSRRFDSLKMERTEAPFEGHTIFASPCIAARASEGDGTGRQIIRDRILRHAQSLAPSGRRMGTSLQVSD